MADLKSDAPKATEKADPTIKSAVDAPAYPEGTHPIRPLSEQTYSAVNKKYEDAPEKPDPSTVAQVEVLPDGK